MIFSVALLSALKGVLGGISVATAAYIAAASTFGPASNLDALQPGGVLPHFLAGVDPTATAQALLYAPTQDAFQQRYYSSDSVRPAMDRLGIWRYFSEIFGYNNVGFYTSYAASVVVFLAQLIGIANIAAIFIFAGPAWVFDTFFRTGPVPHQPASVWRKCYIMVRTYCRSQLEMYARWYRASLREIGAASAVEAVNMVSNTERDDCANFLTELWDAARSPTSREIDEGRDVLDAIRKDRHHYRRVRYPSSKVCTISLPFVTNGKTTPTIPMMELCFDESVLDDRTAEHFGVDLFNPATGERSNTVKSISIAALRFLDAAGISARAKLKPRKRTAEEDQEEDEEEERRDGKRGRRSSANSGSVTNIKIAGDTSNEIVKALKATGIFDFMELVKASGLLSRDKDKAAADGAVDHAPTPLPSTRSSSASSSVSGRNAAKGASADDDSLTSGVRGPREREPKGDSDKKSSRQQGGSSKNDRDRDDSTRASSESNSKNGGSRSRQPRDDDDDSDNAHESRERAPKEEERDNKKSSSRKRSASNNNNRRRDEQDDNSGTDHERHSERRRSASAASSNASSNASTENEFKAVVRRENKRRKGKTSGSGSKSIFFCGNSPIHAPKDTCAAQSVVVALHGVASALQGAISNESDPAQFRKASSAAENGTALPSARSRKEIFGSCDPESCCTNKVQKL